MLQVGKSILVIVNWRADYARSYQHDKLGVRCLDCSGVEVAVEYTSACEGAGHKRRSVQKVTLTEAAPEESKRAERLYGRLHRRFAKLGYACGEAIYLLGADADLEGAKGDLRAEFDAANGEFQRCNVDFDLKEIVLVPGEINEETLKSIRRDVEGTIQKLLDALRSGDLKSIKAGARDARQLAHVLEGDSKAQAGALVDFAQGIAKRLREAADESTLAVEEAVEEAKNGAARFAAILLDEGVETEAASAA